LTIMSGHGVFRHSFSDCFVMVAVLLYPKLNKRNQSYFTLILIKIHKKNQFFFRHFLNANYSMLATRALDCNFAYYK